MLLSYSNLHASSFWQRATSDLDLPAAHNAFELLLRLCLWYRRSFRDTSPHPAVHGFICQPISLLVVFAQRMADREPIQLRNQFFRPPMQILQDGILHLVDALDLSNEELGIADNFQR